MQASGLSVQNIPARGILRLVVLGSGIILLLLLLGLSYRSIGYIAINRTYSCVQDDIDSLAYINTMIDVDTGLLLVDPLLVENEVSGILQNIKKRACGGETSSVLASSLVGSQTEVENMAVQYLELVDSIAGASSGEEVCEFADRYDIFRREIVEFEEEVAAAEGKFLIAL